MCIVVISTNHPDYPFILLSNRDEFIDRPTARAASWDPPNDHVLGGRDLERKERGSWLGITKQGRIATLTNFREPDAEKALDKSRGGIINAYLTSPPSQREGPGAFARRLINDVGINDVGGFSLMFGELRPAEDGAFPGLSILSNRSASAEDLILIATRPGETHGLSNSHFGDSSWPKVVQGEQLLKQAIANNVESASSQDDLIQSLFDILSVDNMPKRKECEDWDTYVLQMRNSIFIPPTGGPNVDSKPADQVAAAHTSGVTTEGQAGKGVQVGEGSYGTQKQTVILVDRHGKVSFREKTLYGEDFRLLDSDAGERRFEFEIEGWNRRQAAL